MPNAEPQNKFKGNIALYIYLKKYRNPVFLERNLRKTLSYHYRRQGCPKIYEGRRAMKSSSKLKPSPRRGRDVSPVAPTEAQPIFKWSIDELIQTLSTGGFGPHDPVLRIDVTAITDRLALFRDRKHDVEPPRKQARRDCIDATCGLTIWDAAGSGTTNIEQARNCKIYRLDLPDDERGATVILDEPFFVRLDQLEPYRSSSSHTQPEIVFSMQIVLMAANKRDTWPPIALKIPPAKTKTDEDSSGLVRFPVLAAKWHRLPRVPVNERESVLDLVASQDNHTYRRKIGLKIDATWCNSPTPLEISNIKIKRSSSIANTIATPEPDVISNKPKVTIDWIFKGCAGHLADLQFPGFVCPMCAGKEFKEAYEFHFHLINSHSLFKFDFSLHFHNHQGQSVARGTVAVNLSDDSTKIPHGMQKRVNNSEVQYDWEKPKTPLELEAYLKGDESWLGKKSKRNNNHLTPHVSTPRSRSHESSKAQIPLSAIERDPDKVPDLVPAQKRKFVVPKAPEGTQFFRLLTKRVLEEGEEISESDDDINEDWLLEKHADTIDSFTDTTREEKKFIQRFDRHILQEDVSSDLHSGEALIRFCRKNAQWLQQEEMKFEFHKKAATLKIQGCISRKTIWACIKIIDTASPKANPDAMDLDSPTQPNGPSFSNLDEPQTPPPEHGGDIFGRCAICRLNIHHPKTYLICNNAVSLLPSHPTPFGCSRSFPLYPFNAI